MTISNQQENEQHIFFADSSSEHKKNGSSNGEGSWRLHGDSTVLNALNKKKKNGNGKKYRTGFHKTVKARAGDTLKPDGTWQEGRSTNIRMFTLQNFETVLRPAPSQTGLCR